MAKRLLLVHFIHDAFLLSARSIFRTRILR